MKRDEALKILGLDKALCSLTPEIVQEAFKARLRDGHPDSNNGKAMPLFDADKLTEAKKVLLEQFADEDSACKLCKGSGRVRASMGTRQCVACKGTGVSHAVR